MPVSSAPVTLFIGSGLCCTIALKGGEDMPLQVQPLDSKLKLRFEIGTNENGNPKYSTRTYSGIKPAAENQDVYNVAAAFVGLQEYPVSFINRVNEVELFDL